MTKKCSLKTMTQNAKGKKKIKCSSSNRRNPHDNGEQTRDGKLNCREEEEEFPRLMENKSLFGRKV